MKFSTFMNYYLVIMMTFIALLIVIVCVLPISWAAQFWFCGIIFIVALLMLVYLHYDLTDD